MFTSRQATLLLLRAPRSPISISISTRHIRARPLPRLQTFSPVITKSFHSRFYSQDAAKPSKFYSFEEIQGLIRSPSPDTILIDTREPAELQTTGTIPGSLNIPVTSKPDSWFITEEEFEDRFGFERPGKEKEVVFYCKAGVRCQTAAELARQGGWENVSEYPGSWLDWEKNGGEREGGQS